MKYPQNFDILSGRLKNPNRIKKEIFEILLGIFIQFCLCVESFHRNRVISHLWAWLYSVQFYSIVGNKSFFDDEDHMTRLANMPIYGETFKIVWF